MDRRELDDALAQVALATCAVTWPDSGRRADEPTSHRLQAALDALGAVAAESIYVGDTVSDVAAASGAGLPCVGYVNKPGTAEALAVSGAP